MRNAVLILLISAFQVLATGTYSQTAQLNLNLKNATIKEVLTEIEKQSEFYFLYNSELIDVTRKVDISVKNEKVNDILSRLFSDNEVNVSISDRHIVLTPVTEMTTQQQRAVSGKVTDQSGQPLPGVTVVIKGTTQGTVTNADGNYSLSNIPEDATLLFSFVGMRTQEILIGTQTTLNAVLAEETQEIDEVVAVGYGTQKRRDAIGSVVSVNSEKLMNPAYTNFTDMLQGKASGVFVSNGVIRVRGINSISNSTDPLYVIDGVATSGNFVNPNDIESIEILKDASATAIYGSRAAGGVIMISTKSGKKGNNTFNITLNAGITSFVNDGFERADASTHLAAMDLAIQNANKYDPSVEVRPYDPKDGFSWNVKFQTDENGEPRNYDYFIKVSHIHKAL